MNRIALLTSNSQRHRWLAAQLAEVARLCCVVVESKPLREAGSAAPEEALMQAYFQERDAREAYCFRDAPETFEALGAEVRRFPWQGANTADAFDFICAGNVDRVFLFGSSIIRDPILTHFPDNIVNIHLGLSPYYRGSATNFWPLVDGLPECVGATVHHATAKVDGGRILAQARPRIEAGDTAHDIGCKAIIAGTALLRHFAALTTALPSGQAQTGNGKLCRRADFGPEALHVLQANFKAGMLEEYLGGQPLRDSAYPIVGLT